MGREPLAVRAAIVAAATAVLHLLVIGGALDRTMQAIEPLLMRIALGERMEGHAPDERMDGTAP